MFKNSNILVNELSSKLEELLKAKLSTYPKWTLLYRASRDGYRARDFHSKCDNRRNILIVIKAKSGNIFGCYTSFIWNNFIIEYNKNEQNAFIFSLLNDLNRPLIFELGSILSLGNSARLISVCCDDNFGPKFGAGPDICISDNSNSNTSSFSNLGSTFKHPEFSFGTKKAKTILAGSYEFQVDEIEVFRNENII